MTRLSGDRREVNPSRRARGDRRGPSFGPRLNVSVPISFGLPLLVVGVFLIFTAASTDRAMLLVLGGACAIAGALLFASGKRL